MAGPDPDAQRRRVANASALPWLLASWLFAAGADWLHAGAASFMFFLTALRLNHEAIHGNLGFSRNGHERSSTA